MKRLMNWLGEPMTMEVTLPFWLFELVLIALMTACIYGVLK
jgi:hypothetical protein